MEEVIATENLDNIPLLEIHETDAAGSVLLILHLAGMEVSRFDLLDEGFSSSSLHPVRQQIHKVHDRHSSPHDQHHLQWTALRSPTRAATTTYFRMEGGDSVYEGHQSKRPSPSSLIVAVVFGNCLMISSIRLPSTFEMETTGIVIYLKEESQSYIPQTALIVFQRVDRVIGIRILMVGHYNDSRCSQLIHLTSKHNFLPYHVHLMSNRTLLIRTDTNDESNLVCEVLTTHGTSI